MMARFYWFSLVLGLVLASLVGCAPSASEGTASASGAADSMTTSPTVDQIGEALGTVNGQTIGSKEFDHMATRQVGRDGSLSEEARRDIIGRLVDEKLLYQEALRRGIDKEPKLQKMMVNTLLKEAVYNSLRTGEISEDDLRSYFDSHKEDFVVPGKAQVKRILVKAEEAEPEDAVRARAEAIRAEVLAHRDDFKNLAQRYSSGPYARRGGDMGFVTSTGKPGVPESVISVAFGLGKGEVSEVFQDDEGWNIVYVPNRRDRVERSFAQMRGSVQRKVKSERYQKLFDDFVGGLKEGASVEIDDKLVLSRTVELPRPAPAPATRRPAPPAAVRGSGGSLGPGHGPDDGHGH
jgi:peptidyl-prolyl cis-trans isomerase C